MIIMKKSSWCVLEHHYGKELAAESIEGEKFIMPALVSPDIHTEWVTFRRSWRAKPSSPEIAIETPEKLPDDIVESAKSVDNILPYMR